MNREVSIKPVISEKSYNLANLANKYTFFVPSGMSKIAIASEVSAKYNVSVEAVNTIVKPGKMKKDWKTGNLSRKSDLKKAIVKLAKDSKIDDFFNI